MAKPSLTSLLDLDTLVLRHHITIDKRPYELKNAPEFSVVEAHRLAVMGEKLHRLMKAEALTEAEEQELSAVLDTICKAILLAPGEVHAKLHDSQRQRIFETFHLLSLPPAKPTRAKQAAVRPIGASLPRGSRGSTGGRRKRG